MVSRYLTDCAVQVHFFTASLALTFIAMPFPAWTALWGGSLFIYYALTAFGAPEHTGAACDICSISLAAQKLCCAAGSLSP